MTLLVALSDDRVHQHLVRAEEERMVGKAITQQTPTERRGAVLHDITEQRDEQTRDQHQSHEVDEDLISQVLVAMLHELTGRKDELDDLADSELQPEGGAYAPEQGHQHTHYECHVYDLPTLTLAQQTVQTIDKAVHRRSRIVVRFVPLSRI